MSGRPEYAPGQNYHFYNHGVHRLSIFREPNNYLFALEKIKRYVREFELTVIAYCLLPNHYHFLIRQDGDARASLLPQMVFNSYSKAYNRRYDHRGTLFEGSYKVKPVLDETQLLNLCRYIHANPVLHGFVERPEDWAYSNYLEWIGERDGTLVDRDFIAIYFDTPAAYRAFVEDYLADRAALEAMDFP
jgi:REP element-mobilizing transposase RayT